MYALIHFAVSLFLTSACRVVVDTLSIAQLWLYLVLRIVVALRQPEMRKDEMRWTELRNVDAWLCWIGLDWNDILIY